MILTANVPRLIETARASERVLDVGGWYRPFNLATHVIDLMPFDTRRGFEAIDPDNPERFSAETWTRADICVAPWPFPDKFFDFSFCSHTLEDVRDPLVVCRELARVSRAGYIEVPSRLREIFVKARFPWLKLGTSPEVGFYHHRWFCEIAGSHIRFSAKTGEVFMDPDCRITRSELGRKLTEAEAGICLWWDGDFTAEEVISIDGGDLKAFKRDALAALRKKGG